MKKCTMCIGALAVLSMLAGAICMSRKPKKTGVRHAAAKLVEGVNDFLDDLGIW